MKKIIFGLLVASSCHICAIAEDTFTTTQTTTTTTTDGTTTTSSSLKAEITERFYGESIDLNRKHNPCKGRTDGGIEVIVHTKVMPVSNNPARTVMAKSYSLPDGEVIKRATIVCDAPVRSVLHRHFPHKYPKDRI